MLTMKRPTGFLGTYFDRDGVLVLERWVRFMAWLVLTAYLLDSGYTAFQNISGAISGGYPLDWYFLIQTFARIAQGGVLFTLLQVASRIILILLDIEDNTRRAGRTGSKDD
jgi:hypothetical protein